MTHPPIAFHRLVRGVLLACALLLFLMPAQVLANFSFQNTPLKEVIRQIESETGYYFLYREVQIAGIRITLQSSEEEVLGDLRRILQAYDIELRADDERRQVLLIHSETQREEGQAVTVSGQVVDAATGERLPYATLLWEEEGRQTGISANAAGRFSLQIDEASSIVPLSVRYIGYRERIVRIDPASGRRMEGLTIRLEPEPIQSQDIVVSGFSGANPSDTLLTGMIDAGRFSPLGESSSIRALRSHPSVAKGTALNDGLNVRGSTPDGFLVMLDGMSIFNQSHLFGLLDSFNADAIQSSGYYFGVVPAHIDTPTGGTLNLITRTGSLNEVRSRVGLSNTAVNGLLEGPMGDRSSWLISARTSYLDQLPWFNNSSLVQWGLDIDRPKRVAFDEPDFTDLVLLPGEARAQFVDLHGKFYHETRSGGRFIMSGYFGGDRTSQMAGRRTRSSGGGDPYEFQDVETSNRWGNGLLSLQYDRELSARLYSSSTLGVSAYETSFEKEDFVYSRVVTDPTNESTTIFTYPFRNRSSINELKLSHDLEYTGGLVSGTLGGSWRHYRGAYSETSFDRPSYYSHNEAHLADLYLHTEWNPLSFLLVQAGIRGSYFSSGEQVLLAPRLQARISPGSSLSFFGGYAIHHQFLHRVSLENATTADVWILSTREQPPASAEQISTGIEFAPDPMFYLKVEAYLKRYQRLRLHELYTQSLENSFAGTPWYHQNDGDAKGVEVILRHRVRPFLLTQSYTLSRMVFRNPALLGGEAFAADWDRTHSYNAVLETAVHERLKLYLSWIMMSGAPNARSTFGEDPDPRLDAYYRLDSTIEYHHPFRNDSSLEVSVSVFNLLDHENVWYRTEAFSFDETRSIPRLQPLPVDVLDLGIQPSFRVSYSF